MLKLNLGCGTDIRPGWTNVDFQPGPGVDVVADLIHLHMFGDGKVSEMLLCHVLEHLPEPLKVMQELWRIASSDCVLTIRCPHGASDDAWEDPTHVRPYFLQSFGYFSQPYHWRSGGYGYKADWQAETLDLIVDKKYAAFSKDVFFERTKQERNLVREMVCVMRKVDPPRPRKRELLRTPVYDIKYV